MRRTSVTNNLQSCPLSPRDEIRIDSLLPGEVYCQSTGPMLHSQVYVRLRQHHPSWAHTRGVVDGREPRRSPLCIAVWGSWGSVRHNSSKHDVFYSGAIVSGVIDTTTDESIKQLLLGAVMISPPPA